LRLKTALLAQRAPVGDGDQRVVVAVVENALQRIDRRIVNPDGLDRLGEQRNAPGEIVQLVSLVLVLGIIGNRDQAVGGEGRISRTRAREEVIEL
jgi:hypothetical protein